MARLMMRAKIWSAVAEHSGDTALDFAQRRTEFLGLIQGAVAASLCRRTPNW
jgi:hypothetical protein